MQFNNVQTSLKFRNPFLKKFMNTGLIYINKLKDNIKKPEYFNDVYNLLIDWRLYENGWFIKTCNNIYNF